MFISSIKQLRDCGVFRDFSWPKDLPEFGRHNLIYGWNGSGKTTLSRLFRALETKTPISAGHVSLIIDGKNVSNSGLSKIAFPVRVFNRDFVTESVFPVEGGEVAPIFVVGKENVEMQKEADRIKINYTGAQQTLESARAKKQDAERDFDSFCIDRAKVIKDTLRSSGNNTYNNYDKSKFKDLAQKMAGDGDVASFRITESDRNKLLARLNGSPKPRLQSLKYRLPNIKAIADDVSLLLSTTVVSAAIQSLKDDAELASWVHQGLGLHQYHKSAKCFFCDQPMPQERLTALEAHFSTEYEEFLKKLADQIEVLQTSVLETSDSSMPKAAEFYDEMSSEYDDAAAALRHECDSAKQILESLVMELETKKRRVFERVSFEISIPELNSSAVYHLNEVILKHNQASDEFQSRIDEARKKLEADSVATNLEKFVKLRDAGKSAECALNSAAREIDRLKAEIARLEREIVEHRQPAEELNEDLRNYLGHSELRLEIKDIGYTIMRHDVPAEALSEGEMTAIALLYFLKSLQDSRFELTKGVVVLDDPVSSLDANALYYAFGLIRERTQDAAQLFILTHNFAFFRQVRNWFHNLKGQKKHDITLRPARFFMLDCAYNQDRRYAGIRILDHLLEQFESEYHYLFAYIHRTASASPQTQLEQNYILPNMARRLLETFLAFRQPEVSGDLGKKLRALKFDEAKKIRILRFLHTHSHSSAIGEPEHDLSMLSEAQAILNDLLNLMRSQDENHIRAMETLLTVTGADSD